MSRKSKSLKAKETKNFSEFSQLADFSLMNSLKADPQSTKDGNDHRLDQFVQVIMFPLLQHQFQNQYIYRTANHYLKNWD